MLDVGARPIGARLVRAVVAGGAMVGIVAASLIGLHDVADDLALGSPAPPVQAASHGVVES